MFDGKVAVVTGSARGIGRAAAELLVAGGARVVISDLDEELAYVGSLVPLGRAGTTHEAAGGVAFLCSPWSDYVTGQVLNVGGGVPMGMSA